MESFTKQELLDLAQGMRVAANVNEASAKEPKFFSSREIFQKSAQGQRDLADKAQRMAKAMK
jgi:hypothetical protein